MVNKKKSSLSKRYQASYETKSSGAPTKAGVMNYRKLDQEITFYSPVEGRNRINIIPYEIKTKNHPLVKKGEFEIGDNDYVMDLFVHRAVGPSEASVICLKQNYGKPCPICEQMALLRKQGKEEEAGALKPSRRVFYNIEDLKEPGKLKIFETSHFLFEKELIDEARDDEQGGFIDFADEEDGKEIKFRCSKVSKGGFEFNEFKSFSFEDREDGLSEDLLDSAISFDEIMNVPSYEEVQKILFGTDDEDEDEDEESVKKSSKKSKSESEDEDDDEPEEAMKPTPKKKEVVEDDEEVEEKPAKKSSKKVEDDDEGSDSLEDEEEEEKPVKKSCGKSCGDCPFGHNFGKDCDEFDDCDDCDKWDKCVKAN